MRTIALIAFAAATTACGVSSPEPAVHVEASASGLSNGTDLTGDPTDRERVPTELEPGWYSARVVSVMENSHDRSDLYEGAEFSFELMQEIGSQGYLLDGDVALSGWNGRIRGAAFTEEVDGNADCSTTVEVAVQGRAPDRFRFQVLVQETTVVSGTECDRSEMGPAREEVIAYRARVTAER